MEHQTETTQENAEFLRSLIRKLDRRKKLPADEIRKALGLLMDGGGDPIQFAAILVGLSQVGVDAQSLVGGAKALRERMIPVSAPAGSMDIVGTGGDGKHTLNVSTATALLVSVLGVPVAKHGNRAVSSRTGAADVLAVLGFDLTAGADRAGRLLDTHGFAFMMAPNYHQALRHAAPIRAALGIRTLFNLLGPLANPASTDHMLVGVYSPDLLIPYAEALQELGVKRAWVVHGAGGIDELSLAGPNQIVSLRSDGIKEFTLSPEEVDLPNRSIDSLRGGDADHNALAIRDLFANKASAFRDVVLLNTGAALKIAGTVQRIEEGIQRARAVLADGSAKDHLEAVTAAARPQ